LIPQSGNADIAVNAGDRAALLPFSSLSGKANL
jgi:hypothetical protein